MHKFDQEYPLSRRLTKRLETGTGFTRVEYATESGLIRVSVDPAAIAMLIGGRAMKSKSRKSRFMHGAVIAEAVNVVVTEDKPA